MTDDRRYMTWEERAVDDARYRPGGIYGKKAEERSKSRNCSCGKTCFVDAFGAPCSKECPQCGERR